MKQRISVLIEPDQRARLNAVRARTGLSDSEQIRRGIAMWLDSINWPMPDEERQRVRQSARSSDSGG
jgi:hypothetical protein